MRKSASAEYVGVLVWYPTGSVLAKQEDKQPKKLNVNGEKSMSLRAIRDFRLCDRCPGPAIRPAKAYETDLKIYLCRQCIDDAVNQRQSLL